VVYAIGVVGECKWYCETASLRYRKVDSDADRAVGWVDSLVEQVNVVVAGARYWCGLIVGDIGDLGAADGTVEEDGDREQKELGEKAMIGKAGRFDEASIALLCRTKVAANDVQKNALFMFTSIASCHSSSVTSSSPAAPGTPACA